MKKIFNCLICGLLFGAFINHADCSNSKQTNSHTKIQDRHGYDKKGKYDLSSAYSRKYSRNSNPKVADMKNANDDAIKTGLRERLEEKCRSKRRTSKRNPQI